MISSTDFEKLWFMYQTDGAPRNVSISTFCQQNGIPYNEFDKWYRKTHRSVESVEVSGMPQEEENQPALENSHPSHVSGGIQLTIRTRSGLYIKKGGLDYEGLKLLVERLEGVC